MLCFASAETSQTKQAFWGGEGGGREEMAKVDTAFLGSKSRNTLQGDPYKRGKKMHKQLFPKEKKS